MVTQCTPLRLGVGSWAEYSRICFCISLWTSSCRNFRSDFTNSHQRCVSQESESSSLKVNSRPNTLRASLHLTGIQGYFAHKKLLPLGPYRRPMSRVIGGPRGLGFHYGRGTPVRRPTPKTGLARLLFKILQEFLAHKKPPPLLGSP